MVFLFLVYMTGIIDIGDIPHNKEETIAKLSNFSPMPNKIGSKTWSLMLKTLKLIQLHFIMHYSQLLVTVRPEREIERSTRRPLGRSGSVCSFCLMRAAASGSLAII